VSAARVHPEMRSGARALLLKSPELPTSAAWEGVPYKPALGVAWFEEQCVPIDSTPISNGMTLHEVLFIVKLNYPASGGTLDVELEAGELLDLFKVGTRFSHGATDVLCTRVNRDRVLSQPDWVSVVVKVRMQAITSD
jgi:hypothetical protein